MKAAELCLVVIYNHKFERNVERVESLYAGRFRVINHILPFCPSKRPGVIGVYESSYRYQGYIAQAASRFAQEGCSHYVFIGDDLILHPSLHADNLLVELGLADAPEVAYVCSPFAPLARSEWVPQYTLPALLNLIDHTRGLGVNFQGEIPSKVEAVETLRAHGVTHMPFDTAALWRALRRPWRPRRGLLWNLVHHGPALLLRRSYLRSHRDDFLPFPLLCGFCDFFVLPAPALAQFTHLCGVFAAMGIWVEMALPTALALVCPEVRTVEQSRWKAGIMGPDEQLIFAQERDYRLERLFEGRSHHQYLHPIKLSQWK